MSPKNKISDNFKITELCVESDIREAHIFSVLLMDLVNPLYENKSLLLHSRGVIECIQRSFIDSYVMCLCKLYADSNEHGLIHLINTVRRLLARPIDTKLERMSTSSQVKVLAVRAEFEKLYGKYLKKINLIQPKIRELRNIFRAHNLPEKEVTHDVTLKETKEWLQLAEEIYSMCLDCMGEKTSGTQLLQPEQVFNGSRYFLRHLNRRIFPLNSNRIHWSDKHSKLKRFNKEAGVKTNGI